MTMKWQWQWKYITLKLKDAPFDYHGALYDVPKLGLYTSTQFCQNSADEALIYELLF